MAGMSLLRELSFIWAAFAAAALLVLGLTQVRQPQLARQRIEVRSARGAVDGEPYR